MKNSYYNIFLISIVLLCSLLFLLNNLSIHAKVTEGSIPSEVTVQKSLAISFSSSLAEGITFGTVNLLPAENVEALENKIEFDNSSGYYIIVSEDGNVDADFCIKADGPLRSSAMDSLGLGNETYSNSTFSDFDFPSLSEEVPLNTSYVKSGNNISVGSINYYRFWLDVPGGQSSGNYNNTLSFKGVQTGFDC
jgi:hypothetical protein